MTQKTVLVLMMGTCVMMIPMMILARTYKFNLWKCGISAVLLTVVGTFSTYIWYLIENFSFGGRSFYGAVFLVPLMFFPVAKLLRIDYGKLMDLCAPAECMMLSIMKYQCLKDGCCMGRVLYTDVHGVLVRFPSQIAETISALLLAIILMLLARKPENRGKLFPWYMLLYGVTRFVLNLFRAEEAVFLLGMTAGNFWSIISVAIGTAWLCLLVRKDKIEINE